MKHGPDRLNTAVRSIAAILLIAAGAYGLARGYGVFGEQQAADPVLTESLRDFVARNANWFWPTAAVAALLVSWLGLRWLLAQLVSPSISRLPVRADGPGYTELLAAGATAALARDIERYPGVRSASARLVADRPVPEVDLAVDVHDDADIAGVRRHIEEHALARFGAALEVATLRSEIHLRLADRAGRAVR